MAATISVGDMVEISWLGTELQETGTIEHAEGGAVKILVSGQPHMNIFVSLTQLREAGPCRWVLEL